MMIAVLCLELDVMNITTYSYELIYLTCMKSVGDPHDHVLMTSPVKSRQRPKTAPTRYHKKIFKHAAEFESGSKVPAKISAAGTLSSVLVTQNSR